jgi:hypothetical protein
MLLYLIVLFLPKNNYIAGIKRYLAKLYSKKEAIVW